MDFTLVALREEDYHIHFKDIFQSSHFVVCMHLPPLYFKAVNDTNESFKAVRRGVV